MEDLHVSFSIRTKTGIASFHEWDDLTTAAQESLQRWAQLVIESAASSLLSRTIESESTPVVSVTFAT